MASYRVQVWSTSTSDFSPSALVAEFENPKNLGYGSYLNDIGEAFFTISQYDPKVNIRSHEGKGHVVIIRNDGANEDVVWRGILGEHDANARDVIFYAYGYEHLLHSLYTKWSQKWRNQKIAGASGRPVDDLWARAIALNDSPVQWIATGTLQSLYNNNSKTTEITLNRYRTNWKRILTALRELVAIGTSDSVNAAFMEIDYPSSPTDLTATFNFWSDNASDQTKLRLEYGGNVMDYNDRYTPVLFRNQTLGVGSGPRNQLYRYTHTVAGGTFGRNTLGLRQQNMYLSWVRDRAELKRVVKRRTRLALRIDTNMWVRCFPDSIPPARATSATHELGDRVYLDIQHGITQVTQFMTMMGEQVVWVGGREYVQPMLEDRAGDSATYRAPTWLGGNDIVAATSSATTQEAIPADSRLVVLAIAQIGAKGAAVTTAPTLNGVSGTQAVVLGMGIISQEKSAELWYWSGSNVPAGSTVDLVLTNDLSRNLYYGLVEASADAVTPVLSTTGSTSGFSAGAEVTMNTGTAVAFTIFCTVVNIGISVNTVTANATHLHMSDAKVYGFSGTQKVGIGYETATASGSRAVGHDGNWHHVAVLAAFTSE